jgi:hypothetical protein
LIVAKTPSVEIKNYLPGQLAHVRTLSFLEGLKTTSEYSCSVILAIPGDISRD